MSRNKNVLLQPLLAIFYFLLNILPSLNGAPVLEYTRGKNSFLFRPITYSVTPL